jgi:histidinol-phosphate aminotransferase
MQVNRREWLKKLGLAGGVMLSGGLSISPLTAEEIRKYHPRALQSTSKLNSNENPYGPSEYLRKAITQAFDIGCRYPRSYSDGLIEKIARKEGVTKDHIVITGGSTEGLKLAGLTFARNGGKIIAGKPTFLAMMQFAEKMGATTDWVPVDENMKYDLKAIDDRIDNNTSLVFLCNPNNPTGTIVPASDLQSFCENASKKTMVFSDEAYYDFITEPNYPSMVALVKKEQNVIVSRTFSKVYGLAGLRIGYLVAKPEIANKIKNNMVAYTNILAIEAANAALDDKDFYDFAVKKNNEGKALIMDQLNELNLEYVPSHTNFLFFRSGRPIQKLQKAMADEGILIGRPFPPFMDWCRISTGTIEEVQRFNTALTKVMG